MTLSIMRLLLILCGFAFATAIAGPLYKWVDENGKVHFSDQPPAGKHEEVKLKPLSVISGPAVATKPGVRLYTTTWCGVCKRAKAWFDARGISYTEYDVEKSEIGRQEYRRLNGKGVPIILIGDQRMNGFSEARAEAMLKAAGY